MKQQEEEAKAEKALKAKVPSPLSPVCYFELRYMLPFKTCTAPAD